jgi:hypothetical protein
MLVGRVLCYLVLVFHRGRHRSLEGPELGDRFERPVDVSKEVVDAIWLLKVRMERPGIRDMKA